MMPTFYSVSQPYGELKPKEVSEGTTILAMHFEDGVILAADSRTTCGRFVANRFADKLTRLLDKIYCCRAGSAADTQAMSQKVREDLLAAKYRGETITVHLAAVLFQKLMHQYRGSLCATVIVGGWDEKSNGDIYQVGLGGSCIKVPCCVAGSGSVYLVGLMNHKYRENMCKEECIELAKTCIKNAIKADTCSGGVVRIAIITKDGVERQVHYNTPDGKSKYKDKHFWAEIQNLEDKPGQDKKKDEAKEDEELEKIVCPCCRLEKLLLKKVDDKEGENEGGDAKKD